MRAKARRRKEKAYCFIFGAFTSLTKKNVKDIFVKTWIGQDIVIRTSPNSVSFDI